LKKRDEEEQ